MTVTTPETVTAEAIAAHLKEFIVDSLFIDIDPSEIGDDSLLGTEIGVDSLGFAELMAHLEDTYSIAISDGEFLPENFATVQRIVGLVLGKLGGAAPNAA
ncbi:acyl carrier protein [Kitasatospora sp. GAS204B]|uniref:acyl carrier protein n=1 Tax=unclassified Kitasatospora TaxID=2633591 RepID=UPI002475EC4D|nr:acyl carrier protein [Kitasatospora sp. GAS204B]MDH6117261.1 acyl carrier protein [Kitasatospora sp. GAS204B]